MLRLMTYASSNVLALKRGSKLEAYARKKVRLFPALVDNCLKEEEKKGGRERKGGRPGEDRPGAPNNQKNKQNEKG